MYLFNLLRECSSLMSHFQYCVLVHIALIMPMGRYVFKTTATKCTAVD